MCCQYIIFEDFQKDISSGNSPAVFNGILYHTTIICEEIYTGALHGRDRCYGGSTKHVVRYAVTDRNRRCIELHPFYVSGVQVLETSRNVWKKKFRWLQIPKKKNRKHVVEFYFYQILFLANLFYILFKSIETYASPSVNEIGAKLNFS